MKLPFETFESLMKAYLDQVEAERELCEGFKKYNGTYGPILQLPLTSALPDILDNLYENSFDTISWWLFEVGEVKNYKNSLAKIKHITGEEEEIQEIKTLRDLWELLEKEEE